MSRRAMTQEEAYGLRKHREYLTPRGTRDMAKAILARLRLVLPTTVQVRIGTVIELQEACGATERAAKVLVIRPARGLTPLELEDLVLHEYAHARTWASLQAESIDHGPHWALEFGLVYRRYHQIT